MMLPMSNCYFDGYYPWMQRETFVAP